MSTPLAMPPQPFSTVFYPTAGLSALRIPADMRNAGMGAPDQRIELPVGVVQIIVTWKGVEPVSLRHYTGVGSNYETLLTIPASATVKDRSSGVVTIASDKKHGLMLHHGSGSTWSTDTISKGYVAGLQVIPMGTNADITGGGSLLRTDTSVGTRVFLGNTMIHGDTGRRNVSNEASLFLNGAESNGMSLIARQGNVVVSTISVSIPTPWTNGTAFFQPPLGFRPRTGTYFHGAYQNTASTYYNGAAGFQYYGSPQIQRWQYVYYTTDPWPTSLPGAAG